MAAAAPLSQFEPEDQYNRNLVANVHPSAWVNPVPQRRYNLVVVGGGTAGLVAAAGAAGLGAPGRAGGKTLDGRRLPQLWLRSVKGVHPFRMHRRGDAQRLRVRDRIDGRAC